MGARSAVESCQLMARKLADKVENNEVGHPDRSGLGAAPD